MEINKRVMFECPICRNMVTDPVTIPCGHTFCRSCLVRDTSKQCKNCGTINRYLNVARIKSNVLLTRVIDTWFPDHIRAVKLKVEANDAFMTQRFEDAITLYSSAIELAPCDHILWSNRSHAYSSLDRYKEALNDAEEILKLRPDWPKGYFRRGCALYGLGQYEESVVALLQCLALDSSINTAKDYLSKALHNIIQPLSPDDPKTAELQRELNPSLLDRLIRSNFDSSLLLPVVTVDTVRQLKKIITDTVTNANNFLEGKDGKQNDSQGFHANLPSSSNSQESYGRCVSAPSSRASTPPIKRSKRVNSFCTSLVGCEASDVHVAMATEVLYEREKVESKQHVLNVDPSLLNQEEFECSLCYRLLHLPVTTPCGHVFCRPCLDKVLDHKTECPLCKSSLAEYLAERRQAVTSSVENILETYFATDVVQRKLQHEEELAELAGMGQDTQHEAPIFVCAPAYPFVPCPLHIFEPRYRLMIRQCMESGRRQFGMCSQTGDGESDFSDYGCMLEIRDVQFFPDGRSLVDTIGGKRFKVISRGQREGYNTAKVEYISDKPTENYNELKAMSENLYAVCKSWYDELSEVQKSQIRQHLGEFPDSENETSYGSNGTAWHWWMVAVMPLDPRIQLAMLAMQSYKERLQGLQKVIGFLKTKRQK